MREGVQACLAAGADPDALVQHALAPRPQAALHKAAEGEHLACVEALLAAGANANVTDGVGCTPLQLAARVASIACVAMLLAAGTNPRAADSLGDTALHCTAQGVVRKRMAAYLAVMHQLLAADGSLALLKDRVGLTPFQVALRHCQPSMARCLLAEAPLQPVDEVLDAMAPCPQSFVRLLYASLVARGPLTAEQWARLPMGCSGLRIALCAVLQRSTDEAGLLVRHLKDPEQRRLRALALCLGRSQRRRATRRSFQLPQLPPDIVWRLLALSVSEPVPGFFPVK